MGPSLLDERMPGSWDDVLVVTKLDRLGRNAMDVRSTVERLAEMNVRVHCLALGGVEPFASLGGWPRIDRVFNGELEQVVRDINESIWKEAG